MKVSIQFQYMPDERKRPIDGSDNIDIIAAEDGQSLPIPDVGDTVAYKSHEHDRGPDGELIEQSGREIVVSRKVKTRHFNYSALVGVSVNLVVVDVPKGEMLMRLKE